MHMKTILAFVAMVTCTVVANLLLKTGAVAAESGPGQFSHLLNIRVLFGLISFAIAAMLYVVVLQWIPLNVAQSFLAVQFIAVIVASAWLLAEPIGQLQWVGIALIAAGISFVALSQR